MKKILSSNKGFSLIELIVVIAILGVLVGVAAPNLIGYVEKSRVAADIATIETVKRAAEAYLTANYDTTEITETELDLDASALEMKSAKGKAVATSVSVTIVEDATTGEKSITTEPAITDLQ